MLKRSIFQSKKGKELWDNNFGIADEDEVKEKEIVYVPVYMQQTKTAQELQKQPKEQPQEVQLPQQSQDGLSDIVAKSSTETIETDDISEVTLPREKVDIFSDSGPITDIHGKTISPVILGGDNNHSPGHIISTGIQSRSAFAHGKGPNLYDLVRVYKQKEIVDEESLVCSISLAAINGISFGVEGYSGSGKTYIVDRMIEMLPPDDIYRLELTSDQAIFRAAEEINQSKIIYIPELQKAMQNKKAPIIEVIKNLTEGKDANRIVTKSNNKGVDEYTIKNGISIIYTLALENDFKKDEESSRRLMRLETDNSIEHRQRIHEAKSKRRRSLGLDLNIGEKEEEKVIQHMWACMNLGDIKIIDPFSDYMSRFIPQTQKSIGYVDHYYNLLDACGKFHYLNREEFEMAGKQYIILNLEDHFHIFNMYHNSFVKTLEDLNKSSGEEHDFNYNSNPNWKECFEYGLEIMRTSDELADVRTNLPSLIDSWYSNQIQNEMITTTNFKSGNGEIIAELKTEKTLFD